MSQALESMIAELARILAMQVSEVEMATLIGKVLQEMVARFDADAKLVQLEGNTRKTQWSYLESKISMFGVDRQMLEVFAKDYAKQGYTKAILEVARSIVAIDRLAIESSASQRMELVQKIENPFAQVPRTEAGAPIASGILIEEVKQEPEQESDIVADGVSKEDADQQNMAEAKLCLHALLKDAGKVTDFPELLRTCLALFSHEEVELLLKGLAIRSGYTVSEERMRLWSKDLRQVDHMQWPTPQLQRLLIKQAMAICILRIMSIPSIDLQTWCLMMMGSRMVLPLTELEAVLKAAEVSYADLDVWLRTDFSKEEVDIRIKPTVMLQRKLKILVQKTLQERVKAALW